MGLTRAQQREGIIYVTPSQSVFCVHPDGEGRVWFENVNEAKGDTGNSKVIYLLEQPEDY